jgi:acyl-CoA synthetase (AMP-forming)/AMP-acid ligase II
MTAVYDPSAYRTYFERDFTYLNGFRRNTARYADRLALTDPETGRQSSYRRLGERVDRLAAGLLAAGAGHADVVAYQLFNGPEFAELYLATQAAGLVGSPVNYRLAAGEVAHILDVCRPKVFVYDAGLAAVLGGALEHASHRPPVIVAVGDAEPIRVAGAAVIRYRDLLAERPAVLPQPGRTVWRRPPGSTRREPPACPRPCR